MDRFLAVGVSLSSSPQDNDDDHHIRCERLGDGGGGSASEICLGRLFKIFPGHLNIIVSLIVGRKHFSKFNVASF